MGKKKEKERKKERKVSGTEKKQRWSPVKYTVYIEQCIL